MDVPIEPLERFGLRPSGFLDSGGSLADHIEHFARVGHHRDVVAFQLDGGGAHALRSGALQVGVHLKTSVLGILSC